MSELDRIVRDALVAGMQPEDLGEAVRAALGLDEGYLLDWRTAGGCQLVNGAHYRRLTTCPYRESIWGCEVIGPHTRHRWSEHLMVHERVGNWYSCRAVGDMTLADLYGSRP